MKTLFTSFALVLAFAAQAQVIRFNGFPKDPNTSEHIKGTTVEVYLDGVLQETKEFKGKKIKVRHKGKGAIIIKISKSGYDDIYVGMDYSAAPETSNSSLDIPFYMPVQGTGKGDEGMTLDWRYDPNQEIHLEMNAVTQGELKARLKG
jgi:hypothetical protein